MKGKSTTTLISSPLTMVYKCTIAILALMMVPMETFARNEVEPNNLILDAELLTSGTEIIGSLETNDDVDWFAVEIEGKASIQIEMSLANLTGPRISPYSSSEWEITFYDDKGNFYQRFNDHLFDQATFSISSPGEGFVYFTVRSSGFFWDEEYAFTVSITSSETTYGDFSGLWQTSKGEFLTVHQTERTAVIGILYTSPNAWEAHSAEIDKNILESKTVYGAVASHYEATLIEPGLVEITQISCAPIVPDAECLYADGETFTASRVAR